MGHRQIPAEAILDLRQRLERLPSQSAERRRLVQDTAQLYGVSDSTLYRALRRISRPHALRRADYGQPRVMAKPTLSNWHYLQPLIPQLRCPLHRLPKFNPRPNPSSTLIRSMR